MKILGISVILGISAWVGAQEIQSSTSKIADVINPQINPCEDFYAYACGKFEAAHPVPADQSRYTAFEILRETTKNALRDVLDTASNYTAERSSTQKRVGDFYAACMDTQRVDALGAKPLVPMLNEIGRINSRSQIASMVGRLHQNGSRGVLFAIIADTDYEHPDRNIARIVDAGLGLPDRGYYLDEDARSKDIRAAYAAYMLQMLQAVGYDAKAAQEAQQQIMAIETDLAKAQFTRVERRDPQKVNNKRTLTELQALSPSFDWKSYFSGIHLAQPGVINVEQPSYIGAIEALLGAHSVEAIKQYLKWQYINDHANYLSRAFVDAKFAFYEEKLSGAKKQKPRWHTCIASSDANLGDALGVLYLEQAYGPKKKQRMDTLINNLESALSKDIESLAWMTDATKQNALKKLNLILAKIGGPSRPRSYEGLHVDRTHYFGNIQNADRFQLAYELNHIGKPVDRNEWFSTAPTVNAYYSPNDNTINFPAGILQPPMYDDALDDAYNYGAIGAVIGHEMTHGFDDQGRQYDGYGALVDWWTPQDAKNYQEKAQCFVDQYSQFTVDNPSDPKSPIHVNGKLTLGENVADNGGLRLAYLAYQLAHPKSEQKIDNLTPEQRIFLGWSQAWCGSIRPEAAALRAQTDPHSPTRYRVTGVIRNMPEFQKAFQCKATDPMVAKNTCRIW